MSLGPLLIFKPEPWVFRQHLDFLTVVEAGCPRSNPWVCLHVLQVTTFSLCLLVVFPLVCWCPVFHFRAPLMVPSHLSPNMSSVWGRVFGSRIHIPGSQFNTDHFGIVIQVLSSEGWSVFPLMMGAKIGRKPDQKSPAGTCLTLCVLVAPKHQGVLELPVLSDHA